MTTLTSIILSLSLLTSQGIVDKITATTPTTAKQCVIDAKEPVVNGKGVFTMKEYCAKEK